MYVLIKDKTMVSKYNLHVIGGQTEVLDLTVTSQRARIQVSKTDINLGINVLTFFKNYKTSYLLIF